MPVLLQAFPQGLDAADASLRSQIRLAHDEWNANSDERAMHTAWLRFVRANGLGWPDEFWREGQSVPSALSLTLAQYGETVRPDGVLVDSNGAARLLWMQLEAGQKPHSPSRKSTWNASPQTRMTELLRATNVPLGLVSNGEDWVLVYAPVGETASYVKWNATLWGEEGVTWRAFTSLLGGGRFFAVEDDQTLVRLFERSVDYQHEVTDQLGRQVRRALELLVATWEREDQNHGGALFKELENREIYRAALSVMMRLVFLLCAEERDLLPLENDFYARAYAVSPLRAELRERADADGEEILERRFDAWPRLLATFRAVHGGIAHDRCPLIPYGGTLFDPDRFPFLEGRAAGTKWRDTFASPIPVDNRTVLHLLESLQVLEVRVPGGGGAQARVVSFRALDIEQIGHVYEGLLDHTVKRADGVVLSLRGAKNDQPEIALQLLEDLQPDAKAFYKYLGERTGRTRAALESDIQAPPALDEWRHFERVCGDAAVLARVRPFANLVRRDSYGLPVVIGDRNLYVTSGSDRRSSGTHYTPRSLTEPLVATTLDPLVYRGMAQGIPPSPDTLRTPRELLGLKICDPACGSAGVLVQVCRYLAEKLVQAWEIVERNSAPDVPLFVPYAETVAFERGAQRLGKEREERLLQAKQVVASRCLFGVDSDPLAIEMAQLSLWLVTMEKNRPFSFLEHALRVGDSLAGVDLAQLRSQNLARLSDKQIASVNFTQWMRAAGEARREIPEIDCDESAARAALQRAQDATEIARLFADAIVAPALAGLGSKERAAKQGGLWNRIHQAQWPKGENLRAELREELDAMLGSVKPLHWPLEFPEVFFRDGGGREWNDASGAGFDAVIGNPPFVGGQRITGALGVPYRNYLVEALARGARGSADLVAYFYLRAFDLLAKGGHFGLVATNTIAQGETREVGLDQIARAGGEIYAADPSLKWPGTAALEVALVHVVKGEWKFDRTLRGHAVAAITPYLAVPGAVTGNPHRLAANANRSFQGSIVLGMGFVLTPEEAAALIQKDRRNAEVLFPYLGGDDLNSRPDQSPSRWVINFRDWPLDRETAPLDYDGPVAKDFPDCLEIVEQLVKPERTRVKPNGDFSLRKPLPQKWWIYGEKRPALYETIAPMSRVLAISQATKYVQPTFVSTQCVFDQALIIICSEQNFILALLNSCAHVTWAENFRTTLGATTYYIPTMAFQPFPFPRLDTSSQRALEELGASYFAHRASVCQTRALGLTKVYNLFHDAETTSGALSVRGALAPFDDIAQLRRLHLQIDRAVCDAYGWTDLDLGHDFHPTAQGVRFTVSAGARATLLDSLLALNHARFAAEVAAGLHDKKTKGKRGGQGGLF